MTPQRPATRRVGAGTSDVETVRKKRQYCSFSPIARIRVELGWLLLVRLLRIGKNSFLVPLGVPFPAVLMEWAPDLPRAQGASPGLAVMTSL